MKEYELIYLVSSTLPLTFHSIDTITFLNNLQRVEKSLSQETAKPNPSIDLQKPCQRIR